MVKLIRASKLGRVAAKSLSLDMEWQFYLGFICLAISGVLCLYVSSTIKRIARRMSGLQPVTWYSTWNRENRKHTLCHFQIFEAHSSGGEYRGKTGSTWKRLSTHISTCFLLIISEWKKLIHEIDGKFPFRGCNQADWLLFRVWVKRVIYWI